MPRANKADKPETSAHPLQATKSCSEACQLLLLQEYVETIANSAGGTAQVAVVAQPSIGFLNGRYYSDGSPTEDTEDCLGRITVGLTRSKSLTVLVSPLDMMGLIGMAQVVATISYGIQGLRRGETTWEWPVFNPNPEQENLAQISRWSLNSTPDWTFHP